MIFAITLLMIQTFAQAKPIAHISVQTVYENFNLPLEYLEVPENLKQSITATKTVPLSDTLVQGKKISLAGLKLEESQYQDVLYLVKNDSSILKYFKLSTQQLDSNGNLLIECYCEDFYFSIPPRSAWSRVVRWSFIKALKLNSEKDVTITFRNKVTGISETKNSLDFQKRLYKYP